MQENDKALQSFLIESDENLGQLEQDIVALERSPRDNDRIASAFRAIHTIKGTCGFFGFTQLETLGVFQASCRVLRSAAFFSLCSVVGFSVTSLMRCQLRVLPDQRSGWHCCAA